MIIGFPPFELDLRSGQLRRGAVPIALRPKTLAVLQYLLERPGTLVTKEALLGAVWPQVTVSEEVVRISAAELRAALGDDPAAPRFIETVPRRGYRFIAKTTAVQTSSDAGTRRTDLIVGRTHERAQVAGWLHAALGGRRQLGFVTGEAGIGKTTLVDVALDEALRASSTTVRIARGQCVEQYAGGEPYQPLLEALGGLARAGHAGVLRDTLGAHAPPWLLPALGLHMPTGTPSADTGTAPGTHSTTLHRLCASLDALAATTPLVLVLEDLHWSDHSTLDLVSALAQRREPAQLLMLCTLRAADAIVRRHPVMAVKRELVRKREAHELLLGGLPATDIAGYLAQRLPDRALPDALLPLLVERCDGNPFLVGTLLDHLLACELLVDDGRAWVLRGDPEALRATMPDGFRALIEPLLERSSPDELRVLEAGSVAGVEFAAQLVAGIAPPGSPLADVAAVEAVCDELVRRPQILRPVGERTWPNGRTSAHYAFRHALYQEVVSQSLSATRRRRLSQAIGEQLEAAYGEATSEIGSELAAHFERSGDVERAIRYHGEAAARARARSSHQETRLHVERALDLMRGGPATTAQWQVGTPMLDDLAWASFTSRGWADVGAARAFAEMRAIAERFDDAAARCRAMEGEVVVQTMRADYAAATRNAAALLALAEETGNRTAIAGVSPLIGAIHMAVGEIEAAAACAERGRVLADPERPTSQLIGACHLLALTHVHRGRIAEARAVIAEGHALAEKTGFPYLLAYDTLHAATVLHLVGDVPRTRALAERTLELSSTFDFAVLATLARLYRAACDVRDGEIERGVAALRPAFEAYRASGERISTTAYAVVVADALLVAGDPAGAEEILAQGRAFMEETGERLYESAMLRLQGECLLARAAGTASRDAAAACFEQAIAVGAARHATWLELRAAVSWCRVAPRRARPLLRRLLERFEPDDDCPVLRDAAAVAGVSRPRPSHGPDTTP